MDRTQGNYSLKRRGSMSKEHSISKIEEAVENYVYDKLTINDLRDMTFASLSDYYVNVANAEEVEEFLKENEEIV